MPPKPPKKIWPAAVLHRFKDPNVQYATYVHITLGSLIRTSHTAADFQTFTEWRTFRGTYTTSHFRIFRHEVVRRNPKKMMIERPTLWFFPICFRAF